MSKPYTYQIVFIFIFLFSFTQCDTTEEVQCDATDSMQCERASTSTSSVPNVLEEPRLECQAKTTPEECRASGDTCYWSQLSKGRYYCTRRTVIAPLTDDEAMSIVDERGVRQWAANNCHKYGWRARDGVLPIVYDTMIFHNELELLEIRLNELESVVDFFVLVESDRTFTYHPKPLHFAEHLDEFAMWDEQILHKHCRLPEHPRGAASAYKAGWMREHAQRTCIEEVVEPLADDHDIVMLSDVDEIPRREVIMALKACDGVPLDVGITLVQKQHAWTFFYELSDRSPWPGYTEWPATVAVSARTFKEAGTAKVRFMRERPEVARIYDAGWHLSPFPFNSVDRVLDKLSSWAHQEERRQTPEYRDRERLREAIERGAHCRRLDTWEDYQALPFYVRQNRVKYADVLLPLEELRDAPAGDNERYSGAVP